MNTKQIKIWYWILVSELFFASFLFLALSLFAESLGIDSGENWGMGRILIAALGFILGSVSVVLWLPRIKIIIQTYKVARFIRYATETSMWILFTLGFCELILQTTLSRKPEINNEKDWGVVPIAGSMRFFGKEGFGITHYLSNGEIKTPFDDGAISIVVLGDSHTEALQVSDEMKFVSLAENIVRPKRRNINIHNLGKTSSSIPDYIYLAPIIKQYYNPEIIVIQLSPNDFIGENGGDSFNRDHRNYFVINNHGEMELVHNELNFNSSLFTKFTLKLMIYSLGKEKYLQLLETLKAKSNISNQFQSVRINDSVLLPDARLDEQLKLLKEAYSGIKIILLMLPYTPNIDKDILNFSDTEYLKMLNDAEKIGGFYIIDPQSEFACLVEQGHLPRGFINSLLPGLGHLNNYGHKIVGDLLAEKIFEITK